MSDNGKENKPIEQLIFKATLQGQNIHLEVATDIPMPTLCYAFKLLSVEIDKGIIARKIQAAQANKIIPAKHGIIDFLRRK